MAGILKKIFKKENDFSEEKKIVNVKLKIYISKAEGQTPATLIILLTKKKAKKLKEDISNALSKTDDYIKINLIGDINPVNDTGKDYSFIKIETK